MFTRARLAAHATARWLARHRTVLAVALFLAVGVGGGMAGSLWWTQILQASPDGRDLARVRLQQPGTILSADGQVLAVLRREHRAWLPLDAVAPVMVQALLATEDRRFWEHPGLDWRRTLAAGWQTLNGDRQGGSTLTQQLARNLYPVEIGRAPTLERKLREAVTAWRIERRHGKREILEAYLNTVPFLYNAWGVEPAARTYFGKGAEALDVLEAATLVAMLKGTRHYNPVLSPQRALQRRNLVLARMADAGQLTPQRLAALQAAPLRLQFAPLRDPPGPAPHFTQQARRWLLDWAQRHGHDAYADGLVLRTSLDLRLQALAQAAVDAELQRLQQLADAAAARSPTGTDRQPPRLEAGLLALEPGSGLVRAWVGSRDFAIDQFDHVSQARRQPGSTFKPFVYGAAFARGARLSDTLVDQSVAIDVGPGGPWRPSDSGAAPSEQPMPLREALAWSRNTITAQLMQGLGPQPVADLARAMGVRDSRLDLVPSLGLGSSAVSLREMGTAYATLANGGAYVPPRFVLQVEDRQGRGLDAPAAPQPEQVLDPWAAAQLVQALRGAVDHGTGAALRSRWRVPGDIAGKTGTTQDNTDGWFIAMHPQLVAGAWVGFNDQRITMHEPWGQGARSALPVVARFLGDSLRRGLVDVRARFTFADQPLEPQPMSAWWAQTFPPPPAELLPLQAMELRPAGASGNGESGWTGTPPAGEASGAGPASSAGGLP